MQMELGINRMKSNRDKRTLQIVFDLRISVTQKRHEYLMKTLLAVIVCSFIWLCFYRLTFTRACDDALVCENTNESAYYYPSSKTVRTTIEEKFLISDELFCHIHNPYLLVLVPSRTGNFDARKAIRETYGLLSRDKVPEVSGRKVDVIIRMLFILGTSSNDSLEKMISHEHMSHRDILQIDIFDSYYNLTAKMLHALKWVNSYCSHVTYILKADEDVFVNIGILLEQLRLSTLSKTGNVFGRIFNTSEHFIVYRDGKWGVRYDDYPLNKYPPYAQGTSYTLTRNLVPKIVHTAQFFPYLHIEDVFITGIISGRIHGAVLTKLNRTSAWGDAIPNPCKFARNSRLAQHRMTPHLMRQTWNALMSFTLTCNTYRGRTMVH